MVNYLGFTLIKLPNDQRYNKMTILKLFHKKKSTICLLVVAPEIRAWERTLGPTEEKKIKLFKLLWVPVLQRPNKPVPRSQLWIHQLLSPLLQATATAPLPSVQASIFSLTSFVSDNNILVLTFQKHYVKRYDLYFYAIYLSNLLIILIVFAAIFLKRIWNKSMVVCVFSSKSKL